MDSTALSRSDSIVLIPTYNEKENIAAIIHAVFELPRQFHILIIDDNSPDGTGAIVKDLQKQFDYVFINDYTEKAKNELLKIIEKRRVE